MYIVDLRQRKFTISCQNLCLIKETLYAIRSLTSVIGFIAHIDI